MVGIGAKGASYGNGDLRSIISAATDGEVIVLTGDTYTYASSSVLSVAKGFTVKADPSLTVRPTVTFSGSASQFFKFTATSLKSVTFDGIDFNGGAIATGFFNSNVTSAGDIDLTVNNCVIRNLTLTTASTVFGTVAATNSNGIYSSVKVTNSRIIGYGMLVTSAGKTTSFANNSFKNTYLSNYAYTGANMITISGGSSSTLAINNVTFNNCGTGSRKILNLTSGMTTTINNSVFKSCGQTSNNTVPTAATGSGNINLSSTANSLFGIPGTIATSPALTNGTLPAVTSLDANDSWYYAASGTAGYYNAATITKSVTTLSGFAYNEGSGPSTASTFTVSGADLFNNLTVAAPANYEVSSDGTTYASSLNLSPTLGVVASQTVYVRLVAGLTAASYTGDITLSSANLSNQTIALTGTVSAGGSPAFTASTGSLTGFNYIYAQGPSAQQSFTVSGTNLTANVAIAAPTNYEVSTTSGSGFGASASIPFGSGTLSAVPVYVRLKAGLNSGSYTAENVALSSTGATAQSVSCSGTVTPPTVTITPTSLSSFFALAGSATPSTEKTFTVGGSNLAGDITITPSTNYEISTTSGGAFAATNPITLSPSSGSVSSTIIYVRLKGSLATASYSENITVATAGTSDATVACSGNVATPVVQVGNGVGLDNRVAASGFTYVVGAGPSASQGSTTYVSGLYLQGDVTATAPTNFEVSKDNITFADFVTYTMSNSNISGNLYTRLKSGLLTDTYSGGSVTLSSTGAANRLLTVSGSVTGGAVIFGLNTSTAVVSTIPTPFTYAGNGPSASSNTIRITCSGLTSDVTITPSAGFEVSTDGTTFQSTPMAVANDGFGAIAAGTIIYTRMAASLSVGAKTGTITLTATNATTRTVTVSGTVLLTPTVTVTPIGTYTYNGSPQGPTAATNTGTGSAYTFSYVGTGTTIYTASPTRPTELGTYSVTATVAAHGNYAQASSAATAFNITTETVYTGGNISDIVLTDPELANTNITVSSGELVIDATKTVRSITVNSGAKLTIPTGQTLTLTSFTLKSDASGTSTYKPVGTGALVVTGTTNVEQYLTYTRNYYVSSPVSNAVAPAGYTYYGRNETLSNLGWIAVSVGAGLTAGKGYIALPGTGDAPITFTTQSGGTLNTGTIPVSLTYTSAATSGKGYNLIGNPYPSHLNWTKAFTDANVAKIEPSIWYRTKVGNGNSTGWSFKTYNAFTGDAVPDGTTGIIPPMQGFWVLAKQTTTIEFTDDMRSHETGNPLKAPAANNVERKKVRLQVSNGTRADEALLVFDANASDNYDSYDSPKMMNNATDIADIYTVADAKKLVINGMNTVKYDTEIPIGFSTGSAGDFSISANEFSNFEIGTRLILLDKNYPTIETELTPETTYHFSAPVTTASTNRFSLLFRAPGTATGIKNTEKLHVQVFVNAANQITIIAAEKSDYAIYNAVGQLMENGAITSNSQTSNIKLAAGIYVVMVGNNSARVIIK